MFNYEKRILGLNPDKINCFYFLDKFKRSQSISFELLFPKKKDGYCDCGCGQKLTGKRTRYASNDCCLFTQSVWGILSGHSEIISKFLKLKFKNWACCNCGVMDKFKELKNGLVVNCIHKDHIMPVHKGGGGCWLDNYQLLCDDCHKDKTKKDNL